MDKKTLPAPPYPADTRLPTLSIGDLIDICMAMGCPSREEARLEIQRAFDLGIMKPELFAQ